MQQKGKSKGSSYIRKVWVKVSILVKVNGSFKEISDDQNNDEESISHNTIESILNKLQDGLYLSPEQIR